MNNNLPSVQNNEDCYSAVTVLMRFSAMLLGKQSASFSSASVCVNNFAASFFLSAFVKADKVS